MPDRIHRVLVVMHHWVGYLYGVQLGMAEYFVQRPNWIWSHIVPAEDVLGQMSLMNPNGVIAYVERGYLPQLRQLGVPVVDVSNWLPEAPFPCVLPDDVAIGRLAAESLMDLGLRHFGMVGLAEPIFSKLRRQGFTAALAEAGFSAEFAHDSRATPSRQKVPEWINPRLLAWVTALPKPAGIFATQDSAAIELLDICRHAKIQVPEQICVLGVDNDELMTKISTPPLSSIALPTAKIGYEAARLLDHLMAGGSPPSEPLRLPPVGVVARQSTHLLAIADDDVREAVRFIREHVHERVTVEDVLRAVPVNRRYLERKFAAALGRTPLQEIRRVRLEKAKELLSGSDLSMAAIARRSGFPNSERLANVFHDMTGTTPSAYRRKFRLHE